ncbi:YraN family protein [Aquabacterium sp. A3]|uniref:YraN family protein n=1 Tax=Aquabacterium sp. A3 TaxID=3132829 RepID=UPI00311A205D
MLASKVTTKSLGDKGEERALAYLLDRGWAVLERNYRVARGPGRRGAEIDLIMREPDGTVVFVEVRQRRTAAHGGAAASVSHAKQRACVWGAQHYLQRWATWPPCRFDVIAIDGDHLQWLPAAFDASAAS